MWAEIKHLLESFVGALDIQALFLMLVAALAARSFSKAVQAGPIEMWQFWATKTSDGQHYADANKLGIVIGIFASTLMVGYMFWAANEYNWYLVAIFFIWLTFIGGVEYFSKVARMAAARLAEKKLETK